MAILLVGLNHRTAPVALRERLALGDDALQTALGKFKQSHLGNPLGNPLRELLLLSTCNRFELYTSVDGEDERARQQGWAAAIDFLLSLQEIARDELTPHLYLRADQQAIEHLLRVASGLDSMILGEPQILGQLGRAYQHAHAAGTTGPLLSHLSTQAIHTGKRVRTETAIARHTTSISHAALGLAKEFWGDLRTRHALIVGAGDMAKLAAQAAQNHNVGTISIVNRTFAKADVLAGSVGGRAVAWQELSRLLRQADFVLSATGAPQTVIQKEAVAAAMIARGGRPLLLLDIAVPRDIEPATADLPNVTCCDVDDLQDRVDANMAQRHAEVPRARAIVATEVAHTIEWLAQRKVVPLITALRKEAKAMAAAEVAQAKQRLHPLDAHAYQIAAESIERLAHRLLNKLLHQPTVQLKNHAAGDNGYARMVSDLFALAPSIDDHNKEPKTLHDDCSDVGHDCASVARPTDAQSSVVESLYSEPIRKFPAHQQAVLRQQVADQSENQIEKQIANPMRIPIAETLPHG